MDLTGTVSSGLGRAHVFMAQPHYQDQFRAILGSTAWPGTLNINIDDAMFSHYIALRQKAGIDTWMLHKKTETERRRTMLMLTSAFESADFYGTAYPLAGLRHSKASFITENTRWNVLSLFPT